MTQFAPIAVVAGGVGLVIAVVVYLSLKRHSAGSPAMQELASLIESGAMAFLRREYTVLLPFILVVAALLAWVVDIKTGFAYILGGGCSITAGLFGMKAATKANVRTSEAARESGQARALGVAFSGGAVMGLAVASLGLLGIG
ncbi:MAG TPA: sodium/proton-translocating pyrophosphatase, partial [Gemmatimonadales bacterium]|nr:sodium/proton-translocating pyrophosphatase [Gemmatimonadales bacterium]